MATVVKILKKTTESDWKLNVTLSRCILFFTKIELSYVYVIINE